MTIVVVRSMSSRRNRSLGTLELQVLTTVQEHHPASVREVTEFMAANGGQARTTILTTLERLRKKGHLTRRKIGGVNRYSPKVSREELLRELVGDFVEGSLGGSVSPFVAYLGDSVRVTEEELEELHRVVRELGTRSRKRGATPSQRKRGGK